jgi:type II secretory pathway pseudopilin PulG
MFGLDARRSGFTLVEIMIVCAVLMLLTAIAIPNVIRARLNANESATVAILHNVSTAAQSFWATQNQLPTTLNDLGSAIPPYIDAVLGCATQPCLKKGYNYSIGGVGNPGTFYCYATPQTPGTTGVRSFCITADGVVHVNAAGVAPADEADCTSWNVLP